MKLFKPLLFSTLILLLSPASFAAQTNKAQIPAQSAKTEKVEVQSQKNEQAPKIDQDYDALIRTLNESLPASTAGDYLSPKVVPLQKKELQALDLSGQWSKRDMPPMLSSGGKLIYVHGASMPTIIAAPMRVCDVELEPGEQVDTVMLGDSARWILEVASSGSSKGAVTHLFIKPMDAGLETSAVITTDRRVYHLRLISRKEGHTPYVGFSYASDLRRLQADKFSQESKEREWQSAATVSGSRVDLSTLNFAYSIKGKASWKPEQVYDDGRQTFIKLPSASSSAEIPVLLVRKGGQDILVNYRVKESAVIVDGIFEELALVVGVGSEQEKVTIRRGN